MSKTRVSQNTDRNSVSSSSIGVNGEPYNHKEFLKRVETFNPLKWHIKRRDINPLLCARFGWQCIEQNTLQCSGCGTKINYKTNPLWTIDTNNAMASSFLKNLKCAHTSSCIWKNNPCNKSFEQLSVNSVIMRQELIENISTWLQKTESNSIPKIDVKIKEFIISTCNINKNIVNNEICCDIMILCGCGWYLTHNAYIQCRYCNKCISFKSYYCNTENNINIDTNNNNIQPIINENENENETESIIHRLSKLGLKIDSNIRRSHNFHVYETQSLQKQALFNNNNITKPFGSFALTKSINCKQSILTQNSNKKIKKINKINKKRSRNEMLSEIDNNGNNSDSPCPRKKMRISASKCMENQVKNKNLKIRKNRKRKTMDSEYDECDITVSVSVKKRRICMNSDFNSNCNKRKSRKRKFREVFVSDEERKDDEDDDIDNNNNIQKQPCKRVRLDRDRINNLLYFDPINLHNDHCPFKTKNKYQGNTCIFGWNYCLKLLPNDVLYLQQIVQQSKKGNQAKSRF